MVLRTAPARLAPRSFRAFSVLALVMLLGCCWLPAAQAEESHTENVILITFDGLRWQEVFGGADVGLIEDREYSSGIRRLKENFWRDTPEARREALLPFLWGTMAQKGSIFGNRDLGSLARVANEYHFSYSGYNELLTGVVDPSIDSNDKRWNPNITLLEWLDSQPEFAGRVAAFGSWDVFPYILNTERSGLPVNAGFMPLEGEGLPSEMRFLNRLQEDIPSPWRAVRLDAFTHHFALHRLRTEPTRFLYIAYGETDDFAHDGHYDQYLYAARRADRFVSEVWQLVQSSPIYRDRTTLILTTDHGRGSEPRDHWRHHASDKGAAKLGMESGIDGADEVWLAVMGPDSPASGEVEGPHETIEIRQIAATAARLLGLEYRSFQPAAAPPIEAVLPSTEAESDAPTSEPTRTPFSSPRP